MFELNWTDSAQALYIEIELTAEKARQTRDQRGKTKSSQLEGLFKQIRKTLKLLCENPRHPGLATHPYHSLEHPWSANEKVFEAYVQNNTPAAYRIFWCYGPEKKMITILGITPHP